LRLIVTNLLVVIKWDWVVICIVCVCAEFSKMECTHVDYLCLYHTDLCYTSCKAKASAEGSDHFRPGCDGPGPDPRHQCCCTVMPPGPPPFWPPEPPAY
jgi:hypothetical protein